MVVGDWGADSVWMHVESDAEGWVVFTSALGDDAVSECGSETLLFINNVDDLLRGGGSGEGDGVEEGVHCKREMRKRCKESRRGREKRMCREKGECGE